MELYARIKGIPEDTLQEVVESKLKQFDLGQFADRLAGTYSGGNKRKLSVAIAMMGEPSIIFLDEPSTGVYSTVIVRDNKRRKVCDLLRIFSFCVVADQCISCILVLPFG